MNGRFSFATSVGLVVTPSMTPMSLALRISFTSPVSMKNFTEASLGGARAPGWRKIRSVVSSVNAAVNAAVDAAIDPATEAGVTS